MFWNQGCGAIAEAAGALTFSHGRTRSRRHILSRAGVGTGTEKLSGH